MSKRHKSKRPQRPPKLSLYPLTLEQALKKALAIPFVAPKKQKRKSK